MKIALLVCDTPAAHLVSEFGDYEYQFSELFKASCANPSLTAFDVVENNAYPDNPAEYDLICITGSRHSAADSDPWIVELKAFIKSVIDKGQAVFAVCFGHQIVAEAMGGAVTKSKQGWEIGWHQLDTTKTALKVKDALRINQMHQDIVSTTPSGFTVFSSTPICQNHGMISKNVVTIQGHPEYSPGFIKGLINLRRGTIFSDEFADEAIGKCDRELDGIVFTQEALKYLFN